MATQTKPMTTSEFAKATGIPTTAISKLIRDGKLKAKKQGNAWMISRGELGSKIVRELGKATKAAKPKAPSKGSRVPKAAKVSEVRVSAPAPQKPAEAASPPPPRPEAKAAVAPASRPQPSQAEKTYSVPEFAAMTYLTERGVAEWLNNGRLRGIKTQAGEWRVLSSNLQVPDISRLVRK